MFLLFVDNFQEITSIIREKKYFQKEDKVWVSDEEKYDNKYEIISELEIKNDLVILYPKKIFPEKDESTLY